MSAARSTPAPLNPLWVALSTYSIGPDDAALSFPAKLARENGWALAYAERAIGEYKRFVYLAMTADHVVTPSDPVDQVWHLHLTYTRDYWERFCGELLGRPLHHEPTAGGTAERHRHFEQYAATLLSYETAFGPPPADIWPPARALLLDDIRARRVHPRDAFIIPKPSLARWLGRFG